MRASITFMVDPPSGWKYGFPQLFDSSKSTYRDFLRNNGYPTQHIDFAIRHTRCWLPELEEDTYEDSYGRLGQG